MKRKLLLTAGLIFSLLFNAAAQNQRVCGSVDNLQRLKTEDPTLESRMQQIEAQTNAYIMNHHSQTSTNAVITIPVVFHVIYKSTTTNVSDALCQAQLNQLNLDYAKLNADASSVPSVWQGIAANTNIQFCLAQRDPNGNATTGIERKVTTVTSFSTNDNMKHASTGGLDAWNSSAYLNIWVCNMSGGILGYAQFPGGSASTDGVALHYYTVGSVASPGPSAGSPYNLGRTATHEVGHWLNLNHIWGDDGSSCSGTDNVGDTPNQTSENYGCPSFPHTDACSASSPGVMFMNYMDYTDDACMYMFTAGQSTRMNALFASGGSRVSLLSSLGCSAPSGATCGVPSGLASSAITTTSASVNWTAVSGATSYNLQYRISGAASWTTITGASNPTALSSLASGTTYQFQVMSVCASGSSAYSSPATFTTTAVATCGVPSGLGSSSITTTSASVNWTAVSGATSYNLQYRITGAASWTTITGATNPTSLSPLASGTTYQFQVMSVCASGSSAYSSPATFTTTAVVTCGVPSGLASSSITTTSASVSWTAVSGATSYNLQYRITGAASWTTITGATSPRTLSPLTSATAYQFQVMSVCASGSSAYSSPATFTTLTSGCSDQYESNGTNATAKTIATNTDITALIGANGDNDWYKFTTVSPNTRIKITLTNLAGDYDIRLYNSTASTQYGISQAAGTTSETIIRNTSTATTYSIRVYGYGGAFSATQCYTLRVSVSSTNFRTGEETIGEEITSTASNSLIVYPNPAHESISGIFNSATNETVSIRVFDMVGRTVRTMQLNVTEGDNKFTLDLADLNKGIYFIELGNSSDKMVKKFILE